MSVEFKAYSYTAGSAVTTIDIGIPSGTINSDILVALLYIEEYTVTVTSVPAGFTLIANWVNTSGNKLALYWKRANNETGAAYTFGVSGGVWFGGTMACFRGAEAIESPIDVAGAAGSGTSTAAAAPSITTTYKNDLVVFVSSDLAGDPIVSPPAGMTVCFDTSNASLAVAEQYDSVATGTKTATIASNTWTAGLFALRAYRKPSFQLISRRPAPFKPGLAR